MAQLLVIALQLEIIGELRIPRNEHIGVFPEQLADLLRILEAVDEFHARHPPFLVFPIITQLYAFFHV